MMFSYSIISRERNQKFLNNFILPNHRLFKGAYGLLSCWEGFGNTFGQRS